MIWNLIGHNQITAFLKNAIKHNKLAHAYLFYGSKQIGKRTLVKQLIKNIMCYEDDSHKEKIPCEVCDQCQQINKNIHPDVIWIKKEVDKKDITVEQIRQLEERLSVHSFFKNYKIAVIENADQMNLASANALLKTLEEPTKKTILILITHQINKIPKTIISRTQKIKLLIVSNKEIHDYLISQKVDYQNARHLASLAAGRPGRALVFLRNPNLWQAYKIQIDNFFELTHSSNNNKIKFAEKFLSGKETLIQKTDMLIPVLNLWQLLLRDLILYKLDQPKQIVNSIGLESIQKISLKYSLDNLLNLQKSILLTKKYLNLNANPRLVLESLLLKF